MAASTKYEDYLQNIEVEMKMSDSALRAHSEKRIMNSLAMAEESEVEESFGCNESQQSHSKSPSLNLETALKSTELSPEHLSVIREMSLSSFVLGDYLVIVKSDFDLVLSNEPYLALMLLLNRVTGKYIARIWNRTVFTGTISSVDQLRAVCMEHFEHMPCLGLPFAKSELEEADFDFMVSHAPVLCKVSKSCLKVMSKHARSQVRSCSECLKLKH